MWSMQSALSPASAEEPSKERLFTFVRYCCKTDWVVILGFGLYVAWMTIGITPSLCAQPIRGVVAFLNSQELMGRLVGVLPIGLLGILAYRRRCRSKGQISYSSGIAGGVVAALCTAALYLSYFLDQTPQDASESLTVFAVLSIAGSSVLLVVWGVRASTFQDRRRTLFCLASAHAIGFAFMLGLSLLPALTQVLAHIAAPIASCLLLRLDQQRCDQCGDGLEEDTRLSAGEEAVGAGEIAASRSVPATERGIAMILRPFVGLALFAAIMECLFIISDSKEDNPDELTWIVAGLCICVLFIVLTSYLFARHKQIAMESLSRWVMPLFVLGEFFVFSSTATQGMAEVFAMGCAWVFFRLFYWTVWGEQALSSSYPAISVVIVGRILLVCGSVMGSLTIYLMHLWGVSEFTALAVLCFLAIVVSAVCFGGKSNNLPATKTFDPSDAVQCERCADEATRLFGLTEKEREIAIMLASGRSNDQIRDTLVVSDSTVRTHLRNIYKKTHTHGRTELVVLLRGLC